MNYDYMDRVNKVIRLVESIKEIKRNYMSGPNPVLTDDDINNIQSALELTSNPGRYDMAIARSLVRDRKSGKEFDWSVVRDVITELDSDGSINSNISDIKPLKFIEDGDIMRGDSDESNTKKSSEADVSAIARFKQYNSIPGHTTIYEDEELWIVQPYIHNFSNKVGKDTNWCISTAGITNWTQYLHDGSVFVFVFDKRDRSTKTGTEGKWSCQFQRDGSYSPWRFDDVVDQDGFNKLMNQPRCTNGKIAFQGLMADEEIEELYETQWDNPPPETVASVVEVRDPSDWVEVFTSEGLNLFSGDYFESEEDNLYIYQTVVNGIPLGELIEYSKQLDTPKDAIDGYIHAYEQLIEHSDDFDILGEFSGVYESLHDLCHANGILGSRLDDLVDMLGETVYRITDITEALTGVGNFRGSDGHEDTSKMLMNVSSDILDLCKYYVELLDENGGEVDDFGGVSADTYTNWNIGVCPTLDGVTDFYTDVMRSDVPAEIIELLTV